jgi:fused signal recognition particle receptor
MGFFDKLKAGLKKTSQLLRTDVRDLFKTGEILSESHLEKFEAKLIQTDMGVAATTRIVDDLRTVHLGRTMKVDELWATVRSTVRSILQGTEGGGTANPAEPLSPLNFSTGKPTVILVAGVNGTGKTTTIAKLARLLTSNGKTVMLAAGDTFRAAAVEQLALWSQRLGCAIVTKPSGTDPAAVAFAGCEEAIRAGVDVLIIDTAGRLHNQQNLMLELEKIRRVISKQIEGAPHESLLVIDATTGQNGLNQAQAFSKAVSTTGLILSKLDGTARGGVAVAIRQQMGIPVKYVGVGEGIDDLEVFDADQFAEALFSD